ncbi:MAG: CRISPR-associated helicase Cas3' [Cyanobacteriota bacterium]
MKLQFKRLLAKSFKTSQQGNKPTKEEKKERQFASYLGHIALVMQSARTLTDELGESILEQLGLNVDLERFKNTVTLAAYLHDWGKANQHFQEMLYLKSIDSKSKDEKLLKYRKKLQAASREHNNRQMLRHEVISGILALEVDSVRQWLEQCENCQPDDLMVAVWAAMGHHLKIGLNEYGRTVDYCIAEIPDGTGDGLEIYTHHPDFKALLKMGSKFGLKLPNNLPEVPKEYWSRAELEQALENLHERFLEFAQKKQGDWEFQRFIAAVKATVMAADIAGSALPVAEENVRQWIQKELEVLLDKEDIQKLLNQRLQGNGLRPFQEKIAEKTSHRVKWVKAGCGTGKTIGAYAWAKNYAVGRKLFFAYPTTGTASQGYIDYADGTDIEKHLMHSRADLDREILISHDSGDSEGIDARLAALQAWRKKLIICTVDSVLGLIQNNRKPLYSWPAIAQSAFVFDEVHAYDEQLFGALLQFLRIFRGAPILLMSASFKPEQLQAIREVMAELGEEIDEEPIPGPKELEELERYQIQSITDISDELSEVWSEVLKTLQNKQKVLWVTNSVQTCIDLFRAAKNKITQDLPELGIEPLIYHSRYRYKDRLNKHEAVIKAFKANTPVLAITTQVCEMSLDISADLLVSAMAPAAALIQRLGRLNRRMKAKEEGTRPALIYPWNNKQPYSDEELFTGKQLIEQLSAKAAISQQDLAEVAAELGSTKPELVKSNWLEGNWCTHPGFLREAGYTITVLLEEDLGAIAEAKEQREDKLYMKAAQAFSVPIRIVKGFQNWERKRFYLVAPKEVIQYSEETGAEPCQK